jgi:hypothetical protein
MSVVPDLINLKTEWYKKRADEWRVVGGGVKLCTDIFWIEVSEIGV